MKIINSSIKVFLFFTLNLFLILSFIISAYAIDWSKVDGKKITLFHTGEASWEWCLTQSDHSGAKKFKKGKDCIACHKDEEAEIGKLIVSGKKLENHVIHGRTGSIDMIVKTAHDGERIYIRLEWDDPENITVDKMDPENEVKIAVMLDDGNVIEAKRAGCWGTCHDDLTDMASSQGRKISKYLAASRTKVTRKGGGENYKTQNQLENILNKGVFLEYWQVCLNKGLSPKVIDGYILEKRIENIKPLIEAQAINQSGKWVTVISRKLNPENRFHKNIVPGKAYPISFSLHDNYTSGRFHYVAFEYTLSLNQKDTDFIVIKQ